MGWVGLGRVTQNGPMDNSGVKGCTGILVLKTKRALIGLVSLQPINPKYSHDADARDQ